MANKERALVGRSYLAAAVELLHLVRANHPTAGVWEAADLEWWWRTPRPTDEWDQRFWFVDDRPVAAAIATDWGGRLALDVIVLPGATPGFVAEVFHRGLESIGSAPVDHVEVMVDSGGHRDDLALGRRRLLADTRVGDIGMDALRTAASTLAAGHRLPADVAE